MHTYLVERAVNAFQRDIISDSTIEESTEDQLFGELVCVNLSKLKDEDDKEDTKMQILQYLIAAKQRQRARENEQ